MCVMYSKLLYMSVSCIVNYSLLEFSSLNFHSSVTYCDENEMTFFSVFNFVGGARVTKIKLATNLMDF